MTAIGFGLFVLFGFAMWIGGVEAAGRLHNTVAAICLIGLALMAIGFGVHLWRVMP